MAQGTVKWFSPEKGFGFIVVDDKDGEELFVHFSEIKMDGYRTLDDGERVEFEITYNEDKKKYQASNVKRLGGGQANSNA